MRDGLLLGLNPWETYRYTLAELNEAILVRNRIEESKVEETLQEAYYTGAAIFVAMRSKEYPSFERLFKRSARVSTAPAIETAKRLGHPH